MTMPDQAAEALAKKRFIALNLIRITGLICVLLGVAVAQGVIDLPRLLGLALAAFGLYDFFFMPRMLAKRWKSPDQ